MDKNQEKILEKLCKDTGLSKMRCKGFLERNNWDLEKTKQVPVIKSALNRIDSLFEFDELSKEEIKSEKIVSKAPKISESKVVQEKKENLTRRQKNGKKQKESNSKKKKEETEKTESRFRTRTHGGITFEVEIIGGKDYFNGKEIHMDAAGFYHPYATMKDIMEWEKKYRKK